MRSFVPTRCVGAMVTALLVAVCAEPACGVIIGDIVRVGYPLSSGDAVRRGAWTPVVVDLSLQNQASFTGMLRLRQVDSDGDLYVDSVAVNLFADGGSQRRYTLYTVANPIGSREGGFVVELFETEDDSGADAELVPMVSGGVQVPRLELLMEPEIVPDDHYVILAITDGVLGRVRRLAEPQDNFEFDRPVRIAHIAPDGLPSRSLGLEMIDCIVWDEADPTRLTAGQQQSLADWVFGGGKLMLAAARTSDALARSDVFGPLLPVEVGPVELADVLPDTQRRLLQQNTEDNPTLGKQVAVAVCTLKDDPQVRDVLTEPSSSWTIVASRRHGRGSVVFVSASLKELLSGVNESRQVLQFFRSTLELRRSDEYDSTAVQMTSLFGPFEKATGFIRRGGYFLTVAMLFAVAYVLVSTLGAWRFLGSRNLLKHSWSALAVLAVIASAGSIAGVQAVRGVGRRVQQLTIVDSASGLSEAQATCYFGITASVHSLVDVWLPENYVQDTEPGDSQCTLRPMTVGSDLQSSDSGFTDPARYQIVPSTAVIDDVPLRATLKQLEGRWHGVLNGTIQAQLATQERVFPVSAEDSPDSREETVLTESSWIRNDLDVDLRNCYLLLALHDRFSGTAFSEFMRASGSNNLIDALPLGDIKAGERIEPFRRLYRDSAGAIRPLGDGDAYSLRRAQRAWGRRLASAASLPFGGGEEIEYRLEDHQNAALLLTLLSEADPDLFNSARFGINVRLSRDRCRQLDLSDLLTTDTAIFVGFADAPGPVRLCSRTGHREFEPIDPMEPLTVYRFLVPVAHSK